MRVMTRIVMGIAVAAFPSAMQQYFATPQDDWWFCLLCLVVIALCENWVESCYYTTRRLVVRNPVSGWVLRLAAEFVLACWTLMCCTISIQTGRHVWAAAYFFMWCWPILNCLDARCILEAVVDCLRSNAWVRCLVLHLLIWLTSMLLNKLF